MEIARHYTDGGLDFRYDADYCKTYPFKIVKTDRADTIIRVTERYKEWTVAVEHAEFEEFEGWRPRDRVKSIVSLYPVEHHTETLGTKVIEPHSYTGKDFRGQGLVEGIYRWMLDNGFTLRSGDTQTPASNGLWKKLGKEYKLRTFNENTGKISNYRKGAEEKLGIRLLLTPKKLNLD